MKIKKTMLLLGGILFAILMSGCNTTDSDSATIEIILEAPEEQIQEMTAAARGANEFAFRMSAALAQNIGNESFVFSPYSVWLPLAALVNATDDANREALIEVLAESGISEADINRAASRMLYNLTRANQESSPLKIANAIFVDDSLTLRRDFADIFMSYYIGTARNVDFSDPETVDIVNQWAYEQTHGLIEDLVSNFDPLTVIAIVNSIYFYDSWANKFNPSLTAEDLFFSPRGEVFAYFMSSIRTKFYFEDDIIQATRLGFSQGGGMFIILPKSGDAVGFLADMTLEYFEYIQYHGRPEAVRLLLPKFSIKNNLELQKALVEMGVPLFCDITAPLTHGLVYENDPLWASSAMQKAMIDVDEQGAMAAAVTIMAFAGMGPPPTYFEIICNKPFVFILYQDTFDGGAQVLFIGVVNEP